MKIVIIINKSDDCDKDGRTFTIMIMKIIARNSAVGEKPCHVLLCGRLIWS